ncbi:MAG: hypothetical protein GX591_06370 [Planctomycetes bacterium]|nr:hypothetical protein [Planctomycetota bacterium]
MRRRVCCMAVAVLASMAVCGCMAGAGSGAGRADGTDAAIALYVSPAGNDAWSGRTAEPGADGRDGPFRTPQRAQRAVRAMKAAGALTAPVVVHLRGGTYELAEPLVFTPEDSGTAACPITWTAWGGEKAVLSAGTRLSNWTVDQDGRWVTDLSAAVPDGKMLRQVFVNGQRRYRPRLPREGYYHVKAPLYLDKSYATATDYIEFNEGEFDADWRNLSDVEVVVLHFWVDTHLPIKSIDPVDRVARFTLASHRRFTDTHLPDSPGARYWVENVYEAFDQPGQFYQDRKTARLYYLPKPGEDPATTEVIVGRWPQVVRFVGDGQAGRLVEHVRLRGLTFSHTEWNLPAGQAGDDQAAVLVPGAVTMTGARFCAIEDCSLQQLGTYAIEVEDGCRDISIVGNEMTDLAGGGVKISGGEADSPDWQRTGAIAVTDNHIHDGGKVWHSSVGILLRHAADCLLAHNEVNDLDYTGISVGWVWGYKPSVASGNRIEFNHVHHIGREVLADLGGIYTLGISPGTVVRNNLVHDIKAHGTGSTGLYTDEGSSGILLENNIVYRAGTSSISQNYGRENVYRNNILALADDTQLVRVVDELHLTVTVERNIVYWTTGKLLGGNWWSVNFKIDNNLYWNAAGRPIAFGVDKREEANTLESWRQRGHDLHSIVADPLFVDPANGDFTLKPDSPAFDLGFQPIDISTVGPRKRPGR